MSQNANWTPREETLAIIDAIAFKHGMTTGEILGDGRRRKLVVARHEAMRAVAQARPHFSTPQLGSIFHRDHSTLLWALGRTKRQRGMHHNDPAR